MPLFAIPFPAIDPILVQLGPFAIRWYALAYIGGLLFGWMIARRLCASPRLWGGRTRPSMADLDDLLVYAALGIVLGGRIGYVLVYNLDYYLANPLEMLTVWHGGMSFHGGIVGVVLAILLFAWRHRLPVLSVSDTLAAVAPLGSFLGRLANFINGELWGRVTDVPWGIVFPTGGPLPRHPSQLYQAMLEGLLLLAVIALAIRAGRPAAAGPGLGIVPRRLRARPDRRRTVPPTRRPDRLSDGGRDDGHGSQPADPRGGPLPPRAGVPSRAGRA